MKAIRVRELGPPEVMRLEEIDDLKTGPKQVVVKVQAAGVNPVVGSRGRMEIYPRDLMNRDATILGMLLYKTPQREAAVIQSALAAGFENRTLRPVVGMESKQLHNAH